MSAEAGPEPYLGPVTDDVLDVKALEELERLALRQSARTVAQALPPYTGPRTHDLAALTETMPLPRIVSIPHERTPHDLLPGPAVAPGNGRHRARPGGGGDTAALAEEQDRGGDLAKWRAERKAGPLFCGAVISLAVLAGWGARHAWQSAEAAEGLREPFAWAYALVFLVLAWQTAAAYLERPRQGAPAPDGLSTAVVIPVFNEDVPLLEQCLESLLAQSRQPDRILVADDGSTVDYSQARDRFLAAAEAAGVAAWWGRNPANQGKRHAHAAAFRAARRADVYITVDSDAILDWYAVEEGMKPFADPGVQSVAGLLLIANHRRKLLPPPVRDSRNGRLARAAARGAGLASNCKKTAITRCTELWYVTSELTDRSAQSLMSSVLVNTGTFALYRGDVIRGCLDAYVGETFAGRPVQFSDDSFLTFFALLAGKTVQQPTAIGFTAMPENLSHHVRQYVRWMRGMTIRTFWRFRYLPMSRYAYWQHMLRWVQACTTVPLFLTVAVIEPIARGSWSPSLLIVPVLVGYGRSLRYLTFRRYDEPWHSQLLTYAFAPAVALWQYTVLRGIWWWGMATCLKTGWGTRQNGIEVSL